MVTQMFFDNVKYFEFVEKCRMADINVPIIPGLKPLVNERQVTGLAEIFSITVPDELKREIEACKGDKAKIKETGLLWTIKQSRELKESGVPALHYYTMSRTENIAKIAGEVW